MRQRSELEEREAGRDELEVGELEVGDRSAELGVILSEIMWILKS